MSKKLNNLKWESVALEGFPVSMSDKFQGFVGLEECTDYGLDKESKSRKKQKQKNKRKNEDLEVRDVPIKKAKVCQKKEISKIQAKPVKLTNGFTVESCNIAKPSTTNETVLEKDKPKKKRRKSKKNKKKSPETNIDKTKEVANKPEVINKNCNLKTKPKLGENISDSVSNLTPEDMLTWAEFKLPEPIMKALTELGFKKPTKIQELSLPAAIHGRRDILGAAETGSGKTLAFGLPILTGIMRMKEKAEMGLDVYELPYKKTSVKRKSKDPEPVKIKGKVNKKKQEVKEKKSEQKAKESSEDGYGTDEENSDSEEETTNKVTKKNTNSANKIKHDTKSTKKVNDVVKPVKNNKDNDEYREEIVVPIKRKETPVDEGNDSDDSENYSHLSEMLDSDDLADSSDEEKEFETDDSKLDNSDTESAEESEGSNDDEENENHVDDNDSENESAESDEDDTQSNVDASDDDDEEVTLDETDVSIDKCDQESNDSGSDNDDNEKEEIDENEQGIGCVKVIDDIEIPGQVVVKTGKPLYALILTPTRELAIQISRHLIAVAKYTGIRIATIVGGMAAVKQERVLKSGPEIVVATPGRLWELITQGQPHLQQLTSVKFLAIDETDRMIERGHFEELTPLLERLNADEARSGARQNFVFSATLTMVHDLPSHMRGKKVTKRGKIINRKIEKMTPQQKIKRLVAMIGMTDPKVVDITTQNLGTAETLTESRITCAFEHKDAYLYYILKRHPGRTIVFCNSINSVRRLAQLLLALKCKPLPLHASMPQRQRLKNLERFRDDPHGVLIATDVAARGLDIPDVDHVIHYQVPKTAENYVHRSGRTARANKEGLTILMMEPAEAFLYSKLCRTLNKTSEVPTFPVPAVQLAPLRELVSIARELEALELKRKRAAQSLGWREKAAREMDMIIDDEDLPVKQVDPSIDKALRAKKRQLESMLTRPLFPKGFSFKFPTLNDPAVFERCEENALQVMKKSLETGEIKKEKRKSKNESLLKLQKQKRNKIKK